MTRRPIVFLAVSTLMHVCALMIPFSFMMLPEHSVTPPWDVMNVDLVGAVPAIEKPAQDQAAVSRQTKKAAAQEDLQEPDPQEPEPQAGMSFKADRTVGANYLDLLKIRIFHVWKYPDEAIEKGRQGNVSVSFVLSSSGELLDIGVLKSSGSRSLDAASLTAVRQASPFGPLPKDISGKPLKITGRFCYVLD